MLDNTIGISNEQPCPLITLILSLTESDDRVERLNIELGSLVASFISNSAAAASKN